MPALALASDRRPNPMAVLAALGRLDQVRSEAARQPHQKRPVVADK